MSAVLKSNQAPVTMSSREIADLTGKDLSNVHRDIRSMLIELYGSDHVEKIIPEHRRNRHSEFIRENADAILKAIAGDGSEGNHQDWRGFAWERDSRGYVTAFHLDRELTDTLLTGYSAILRRKVIARWHELEGQAADPAKALNDPATLRAVLLGYTEKVIELESQLAEAAPKVDGFDRIARSDGSLCLTDAAKTLQVQPRRLTQLLQEKGWIYRRPMGSGWLAYQDHMPHHLEHKVTTGEKGDGREWTSTQVRVTPRGLTRLAAIVRQEGLH